MGEGGLKVKSREFRVRRFFFGELSPLVRYIVAGNHSVVFVEMARAKVP